MTEYPEIFLCTGCPVRTRPKKRSADDYPFETVIRATLYLCSRCYGADRRAEENPPHIPESVTAHNIRALLDWLATRQQRKARVSRQ